VDECKPLKLGKLQPILEEKSAATALLITKVDGESADAAVVEEKVAKVGGAGSPYQTKVEPP
jgi:hypothetical protein